MAVPLTQADLDMMLARGGARVLVPSPQRPPTTPAPMPRTAQKPSAPYRSRLEQRYAVLLAVHVHDGLIVRWGYEELTFRLAPRTTYTPDFVLLFPDGRCVFDEIKHERFLRDPRHSKSWTKLKIVAARWPCFTFRLCTWGKRGWTLKTIPSS